MHPAAGGALVEYHELLALLEAPERWGQGSDVHGLGGDVQQMRQDAADLVIEHSDELAAARDLDPDQPFDGNAEGMLLRQGSDVSSRSK